ncbi:MAG: hypothetical protein HFI31_01175 [Lachnospiraceae bacterium]|nr:hypothetical protein [Lachnospiraceae bacterium]
MTHKKKIVITGLLIIVICITYCGHKEKENPYGATVAELGDEDAYAFLDMDYKNYVMVTSDGLYDAGVERQAAIYCTVYYYGKDAAINLGTIMSDGTAYPISFSKDGIFAASGHRIEKYAISEKEGELYLKKGVYVEYDEDGNEHYTSMIDGKEAESNAEEYEKMLEEYDGSQVIHFSYGADGYINEIIEY